MATVVRGGDGYQGYQLVMAKRKRNKWSVPVPACSFFEQSLAFLLLSPPHTILSSKNSFLAKFFVAWWSYGDPMWEGRRGHVHTVPLKVERIYADVWQSRRSHLRMIYWADFSSPFASRRVTLSAFAASFGAFWTYRMWRRKKKVVHLWKKTKKTNFYRVA